METSNIEEESKPQTIQENPVEAGNGGNSVDSENAAVVDPAINIPSTFTEFLWEVLVGSPSAENAAGTSHSSANEDSPKNSEKEPSPEKSGFSIPNPIQIEPIPSASSSPGKKTSSSPSNSIISSTLGYFASYLSSSAPPLPKTVEEQTQNEAADQPVSTSEDFSFQITLKGRDSDVNGILTDKIAQQMMKSIPRRYQDMQQWSLIYSLEQHGISMQTLYKNVSIYCESNFSGSSSNCPTVLVVKDGKGAVFGGFVTEQWRPHSGSGTAREAGAFFHQANRAGDGTALLAGSRHRSYYGSGESFLFRNASPDSELEIFPWTTNNDYFMLSEIDFIAMGGGDGKFSLYIDGELYKGYTAVAPTFSNTVPISHPAGEETPAQHIDFVCVGLEIWGFS